MWRTYKDPTGQNTLQTSDDSVEGRLGPVLTTTTTTDPGTNPSRAEINRLKKELTELRNTLQQEDKSATEEAELTKEGISGQSEANDKVLY